MVEWLLNGWLVGWIVKMVVGSFMIEDDWLTDCWLVSRRKVVEWLIGC